QVDPLDAEPAQRPIEVIADLLGAERRFAGRAAVRIADLGRDLNAVTERRPLRAKPLAKNRLACPAAVGVCGVEPPQTDPARMMEQLQRLFFAVAGAAQFGRRANAAEVAAAECDPLDVALAQHPGMPKRGSC